MARIAALPAGLVQDPRLIRAYARWVDYTGNLRIPVPQLNRPAGGQYGNFLLIPCK